MTLILQGRAQSLPMFSQSLENTLPIALEQLGANSKSQTRKMFDRVDGLWWNSYQRVPEKFLVLTRDYDTSDNRYPLIPLQMIPTEHLRLSLPNEYRGYVLHQLAQLRLLPTKKMAQLPIPQTYWTVADFPALSTKAQKQDQQQQRLSF